MEVRVIYCISIDLNLILCRTRCEFGGN